MTGVEGWGKQSDTTSNLSLEERFDKIHELVQNDRNFQFLVKVIDSVDPIVSSGLNLPSPDMPKIKIINSPLKVKFSHSQTYTMGKLQNLIFTYQGSSTNRYDKIQVDHYWAQNMWREDVLCQLTDQRLLNIVRKLKNVHVFISPPGVFLHPQVITNISSTSKNYSLGIDVHQVLGVPVSGWIALQVNARIPGNSSELAGLTLPWIWANITIDTIPHSFKKNVNELLAVHTAIKFVLLFFFLLMFTLSAVFTLTKPLRPKHRVIIV